MKPQEKSCSDWQSRHSWWHDSGQSVRAAGCLTPALRLCRHCCLLAILSLFLPSSSGWAVTQSFEQRLRNVFTCDFQSDHDQNADRQPDGWRRRKDRHHPAYIGAQIVSRDEVMAVQAREMQILVLRAYQAWRTGRWDPGYVPETIPPFLTKLMDGVTIRNCYEIRIDGGAFELVSPQFEIDPRLGYRFKADMACHDLGSHLAYIELHVFNGRNELIEVVSSPKLTGSKQWHLVESDIIALSSSTGVLRGQLHLLVQPQRSGHGRGSVRFDNICVYELPRISLESDLAYNVAVANSPFQLSFEAIGISPKSNTATLELIDIENQVVLQHEVPIQRTELSRSSIGKPVAIGNAASTIQAPSKSLSSPEGQSWTNTVATYQYSIAEPGFYRLRMSLGGHIQSELPISVLREEPLLPGAFGWTMTDLDATLQDEMLVDLISKLGVGLVKVPIWVDYRDTAKVESLGKWLSRIASQKITCIGVLDQPLLTMGDLPGEDVEKLHPAATLSNSKVWFDTVEPVLTSLGMMLDWIQIGLDENRSSLESSNLPSQLATIRRQIHAIGQDHLIAIGWDWREPVVDRAIAGRSTQSVDSQSDGWNAVHLTSQLQLTNDEILAQAKLHTVPNQHKWTSIIPLPASGHTSHQRVLDLVQQMIAVSRAKMDASFMNRIIDNEFGLFSSNLRSSHLLLPWVHVASAISKKQYIGSIDLPNHSINHIFSSEEGTVAILWSDQPTTEQVFLGNDIQVMDLWGRPVSVQPVHFPSGSIAMEIPTGAWPLIVHHVDKHIVRWQQEFELKIEQLPSQIADQGSLPIKLQNTMEQSADGMIQVFANSLFESGTVHQKLAMPTGSTQEWELPFQFLPDASAGSHLIEFAFHIQGEKEHRFSVHREVKLGHCDLELHWKTIRISDTFVELQVEVLNNTPSPVSFDCKLFPRGATYQRVQIINAEPGSSTHARRVQIPKEKIREDSPVWVRCEQIGSALVLNYRLSE